MLAEQDLFSAAKVVRNKQKSVSSIWIFRFFYILYLKGRQSAYIFKKIIIQMAMWRPTLSPPHSYSVVFLTSPPQSQLQITSFLTSSSCLRHFLLLSSSFPPPQIHPFPALSLRFPEQHTAHTPFLFPFTPHRHASVIRSAEINGFISMVSPWWWIMSLIIISPGWRIMSLIRIFLFFFLHCWSSMLKKAKTHVGD